MVGSFEPVGSFDMIGPFEPVGSFDLIWLGHLKQLAHLICCVI